MFTHHLRQYLIPLIGLALLSWMSFAPASTNCTATAIAEVECQALVDLYISTDGANWKNNTGWNVTNTPCDWYGVSCSGGSVTRLSMHNNQLSGTIPVSLGNLSNLQTLYLSVNQLIGSIPASLGNLSKLQILYLHDNQLTDSIPKSLGNLSSLQTLYLHGNQLSGNIPESLGNLSSLGILYLERNQLSGSIPESLGNLSNLQRLYLGGNQLSGSIPDWLEKLENLRILALNNNQLTGTIPELLGNLNSLQYLSLDGNQFIGSIQASLGNLENLKGLKLNSNQLAGSIPASLGNLDNLQSLTLNNNQLSGSIPMSFGNLGNLLYFNLENNELSGTIPASLGNLSKLRQLHIRNNELCGDIPPSLANLSYKVANKEGELEEKFYWLLSNNHLTASDPALIDWLNDRRPGWAASQTPCSQTKTCLVYAIHDDGLNDSQFFTINPANDFTVQALGTTHHGFDIEGMDIHPETQELFASSGDDPATGLENGYIYQVNKDDGTLTPVCSTGLGEISAMSFHPHNHTLWVWADGEGLFTIATALINNGVCEKTAIVASPARVESLTWDNDGEILYGAAGTVLYKYENGTVAETCNDFPSQVEALDMLADGSLLFGLHTASDTSIHSFDIASCAVKDTVPLPVDTPYTDIEGISWMCPAP